MAFDGSIIIETGVDTSGFTDGMQRIEALAGQALEACGVQMAGQLAAGMAKGEGAVENGAQALALAAARGADGAAGQMTAAGGHLAEGLWAGIEGANGWLGAKITAWCAGIVQSLKGALGIASPAKVLADEVGRWLPPGIALGFEAALPEAQREMAQKVRAMAASMRAGAATLPTATGSSSAASQQAVSSGASVVLNQTVYTHDSLSPYELAQEAEALAERERWRIR